jgi:hypothetical protein
MKAQGGVEATRIVRQEVPGFEGIISPNAPVGVWQGAPDTRFAVDALLEVMR